MSPTAINEFALMAIVACSVLPYTTIFPKRISYLIVLVSYSVASVYLICKNPEIHASKKVLYPLLIISALLIGNSILNLAADSLVRTPIFIFAIFVNIFLIGGRIDINSFSKVVSLLGALFVIVGFPTVFLQEYSLLGIELTSYYNSNRLLSVDFFMLNSIMYNPNPFGQFVGIGTLCATWRYYTHRKKFSASLVGINGIGLLLTQSRGAIFATFVGATLAVLYVQRYDLFRVGTVVTIAFAGFFTVGYIYGLDFLPNISFTRRLELWRAAVSASFESPIIGTGPGLTSETISPYLPSKYNVTVVHNSFLRILVSSGIIGLLSYLYIYLGTVKNLLKISRDPTSGFLVCLLVTGMIMQLFESFSFLGISSSSILSAIILGLAVTQINRQS